MKLSNNSNVQCLNISSFTKFPIRMNNNGIIFFYSFFYYYALECLVSLSFLIDSYSSVELMTPKSDGFRVLGVKTPLRL
jgi:hypothetical protein